VIGKSISSSLPRAARRQASIRAPGHEVPAEARAVVVALGAGPGGGGGRDAGAFIKAYRALPSFRGESAFYTWLYRIAINTAKNYLVALGRRAPTTTGFDNEEAEGFEDAEQLRDSNTPETELEGKQVAAVVNKAMAALPRICGPRSRCGRSRA